MARPTVQTAPGAPHRKHRAGSSWPAPIGVLRALGGAALVLAGGCGRPNLDLPPAPTYVITGTVTRDGEPAVNASVHVKGTPLGMVVDRAGGFRFAAVRAGKQRLSVVYLGYRSAGVPVTVPGGSGDKVALDMIPDSRLGPPLAGDDPDLELSYRVGGGS